MPWGNLEAFVFAESFVMPKLGVCRKFVQISQPRPGFNSIIPKIVSSNRLAGLTLSKILQLFPEFQGIILVERLELHTFFSFWQATGHIHLLPRTRHSCINCEEKSASPSFCPYMAGCDSNSEPAFVVEPTLASNIDDAAAVRKSYCADSDCKRLSSEDKFPYDAQGKLLGIDNFVLRANGTMVPYKYGVYLYTFFVFRKVKTTS